MLGSGSGYGDFSASASRISLELLSGSGSEAPELQKTRNPAAMSFIFFLNTGSPMRQYMYEDYAQSKVEKSTNIFTKNAFVKPTKPNCLQKL